MYAGVMIYKVVEKFILSLNLRQVNNCLVYETKIKMATDSIREDAILKKDAQTAILLHENFVPN
jgi:hypothetical protein